MARVKQTDIVEQAEQVAKQASLPDIHHIVRKIGPYHNEPAQVFTVDEVNAYLRSWLQSGYKLFSTHYGGLEADAHIMIYILLKE